MNDIISKQDQPNPVALLRARRRLYAVGKRYQGWQLALTVLLPVFGAVGLAFVPELRAPVAFVSVAFGILDVAVLDRLHRKRMKTAAKLQEDFDCQVLSMRWNEFLVGSKLDPEEMYGQSQLKAKDEEKRPLVGWYPVAVAGMPMHMARLICQRTNLTYDGDMRRAYTGTLVGVLCLLIVLLVGAAMVAGASVTTFVVSVLVPLSPALTWVIRELGRQKDTVELLDRLKREIEKLWSRAMDGAPVEVIEVGSRELQDAIFNHRVSSPLVFEIFYRFKRVGLEQKMNRGAEHWLAEYQARFGGKDDSSAPPR